MITGKLLSRSNPVGCVLGIALLGSLTGCVGYVEGPGAAVLVESPVFVEVDDYVYYPSYECYYSVSRHQYAYRHGNVWVARPAPRGVSVNVLLASPSVRMDFHDSPAQHHAAVARQYPKNWKPAASEKNRKHQDDRQNHHGENHDR